MAFFSQDTRSSSIPIKYVPYIKFKFPLRLTTPLYTIIKSNPLIELAYSYYYLAFDLENCDTRALRILQILWDIGTITNPELLSAVICSKIPRFTPEFEEIIWDDLGPTVFDYYLQIRSYIKYRELHFSPEFLVNLSVLGIPMASTYLAFVLEEILTRLADIPYNWNLEIIRGYISWQYIHVCQLRKANLGLAKIIEKVFYTPLQIWGSWKYCLLSTEPFSLQKRILFYQSAITKIS